MAMTSTRRRRGTRWCFFIFVCRKGLASMGVALSDHTPPAQRASMAICRGHSPPGSASPSQTLGRLSVPCHSHIQITIYLRPSSNSLHTPPLTRWAGAEFNVCGTREPQAKWLRMNRESKNTQKQTRLLPTPAHTLPQIAPAPHTPPTYARPLTWPPHKSSRMLELRCPGTWISLREQS